jgi:hypothetical protein
MDPPQASQRRQHVQPMLQQCWSCAGAVLELCWSCAGAAVEFRSTSAPVEGYLNTPSTNQEPVTMNHLKG